MLRKGDKRDAILKLLQQARFYFHSGHIRTGLYYLNEAEHQVKLLDIKRTATYLSRS